jgi:hypothetical protein
VLDDDVAAPVDKSTTSSPLMKKTQQRENVHDEDLDGEEGEVNCTCDHEGMIDFCIKIENEHDLVYKLNGTACMDCKEEHDRGNIIPSTRNPISLCEGYMKCKPVRCRKTICQQCTQAHMMKKKDVATSSTSRQSRSRRAREQKDV